MYGGPRLASDLRSYSLIKLDFRVSFTASINHHVCTFESVLILDRHADITHSVGHVLSLVEVMIT